MLRVTWWARGLAPGARVLPSRGTVVVRTITWSIVLVVPVLEEGEPFDVPISQEGVTLLGSPSLREGDGSAIDASELRLAEAAAVVAASQLGVVVRLALHHVVIRVDDVLRTECVDRTQNQVLQRIWHAH